MRVTESMQQGRLYLAGDAAHLITPAGGKGMNLAIQDAVELARGLIDLYGPGRDGRRLTAYSQRRLPAIWRTQAFPAGSPAYSWPASGTGRSPGRPGQAVLPAACGTDGCMPCSTTGCWLAGSPTPTQAWTRSSFTCTTVAVSANGSTEQCTGWGAFPG
jgi:FAD binding domain